MDPQELLARGHSEANGFPAAPRPQVKTAKAGDNVGLLLRGVERDQVIKGDVLSK